MKKMNNKGFSLVELIIVMAIMAVLIGVMAPAYSKYVEQAKKSRDVSAIDSMMTAMETVLIDLDARKTNGTVDFSVELEFDDTSSKITIKDKTTNDPAKELVLVLGEAGYTVAGTWKLNDTAVTDSTLKATVNGGIVTFETTGDFFTAVAAYSDALAKRMANE